MAIPSWFGHDDTIIIVNPDSRNCPVALLSRNPIQNSQEFESIEELAEMSVQRLVDFLVQHGRNRFENPEAVAKPCRKPLALRIDCPKRWRTLSISLWLRVSRSCRPT
ncbi:hypothetical protein ACFSVM_24805 [Paenibacillus shunpengii]|uniref:Uncharacterized protein n=1 Tax=Paenibacillus shunpengii TaxID=2054424 RepID=A0ABW5SV52_9BACL